MPILEMKVLGGLLGDTEYNAKYANEENAKAANEEAARNRKFLESTRPAALADFSRLFAANTPKAQGVSDEASTWFRNLTAKSDAYRPFEDTIKPVADYGFARLNDITQYIPSLTRKANNQNAINLGLAPGARSSAVDRAQYSNAGQVYSSMLPSILNWATQNATLSANERGNAQLAGLAGITGLQSEVDRMAYRALTPSDVEAATRARDIQNLGALNQASASNIMGYEADMNTWAKGEKIADDMVGALVTMYSSYYGGNGGWSPEQGGPKAKPTSSPTTTGGTAMPTWTPETNIEWRNGYPSSTYNPYSKWGNYDTSGAGFEQFEGMY